MSLAPTKYLLIRKKACTGCETLCRPFVVRPAWVHSNGCKSRARLDSRKSTAEGKGVRRETESEGSHRQTSGLTDRNLIQGLYAMGKTATQAEAQYCPKWHGVNQADIRRKECGEPLTGEVSRTCGSEIRSTE